MPIYRATWQLEIDVDDREEYLDTLKSAAESLPSTINVISEKPDPKNPDD